MQNNEQKNKVEEKQKNQDKNFQNDKNDRKKRKKKKQKWEVPKKKGLSAGCPRRTRSVFYFLRRGWKTGA